MWLRRCFRKMPWGNATLLAALLLAAGCASGPRADSSPPADAAGQATAGPVAVPEALTMFEQAAAVMASGDAAEAELRFKEFLMRYPQYPGTHVNLAIIYTGKGDDASAQAEIDAALAIDPNFAPALNQQGLLFRKNGKFLEAEAAYLKAVTASPEYELAHYNLGVLYELYLQRLDEALRHFEDYQELVGSDEQVEKWITDLRRRVAATQRTANAAE